MAKHAPERRRCHAGLLGVMPERASVLIVSQDLDLQDAYVLILRAEGVPALGAGSCEEAIALVRRRQVCAVLFDVDRRDDWHALHRLRSHIARSVPIIVLSGWVSGDRSYCRLARRLGCAGFLAKPCPPAVIVEVVLRAAIGALWTEYVAGA
jgi:CheY-like chemotaxis protein